MSDDDAWCCGVCTYAHSGAESAFLACAMCGGKRASATAAASAAPAPAPAPRGARSPAAKATSPTRRGSSPRPRKKRRVGEASPGEKKITDFFRPPSSPAPAAAAPPPPAPAIDVRADEDVAAPPPPPPPPPPPGDPEATDDESDAPPAAPPPPPVDEDASGADTAPDDVDAAIDAFDPARGSASLRVGGRSAYGIVAVALDAVAATRSRLAKERALTNALRWACGCGSAAADDVGVTHKRLL